MSDPKVMLVGELHGLAGSERELRALLGELASAAVAEPDCVDFRVLDAAEPGELVLLASWTSERALSAHYSSAHYRRYRERVGPLLARPSDVVVHHIATTVHALDPNPPDPGELG
jgi:quinol monooxygenase YgiN